MNQRVAEPPGAVVQAGDWKRSDIELWLVTGFREMLFRPVYAASGNALLSVNTPGSPMAPSATFDIVAFAITVLGKKSLECRAVLVWARSTAAREDSKGDWSISEFCRAHGWDRRTFYRRCARGCDKIAAAKNVADAEQRIAKKR